MNTATRIALTVGVSAAAAVATPFLLIGGLQALNNLAWQLSYLLPTWGAVLVFPVLTMGGIGISIAVLALLIAWIWKKS